MTLRPGVRLGPYEVRSWLGAGGMGEVYLATDTRLERPVAVKVLPAAVANTPTRRKRWEREARVISSLSHPHICALYDVGEHQGLPFLVMEYLEGETLSRRLARGPLPVDDAVAHTRAIAGALSHAHREGIIHRDLKPANIMITPAGAKLLDFGLAALQAPGPANQGERVAAAVQNDTITEDGMILGTVNYMAPEQLEGRPTDIRADIFALGAVAYEMLTGQRAFDGESKAGTIAAILDREPRPLSVVRRERLPAGGETPPALESIVGRCLAKNADDRWQTARDLCAALALLLEAAPGGVRVPAASGSRRLTSAAWAAALLAGAAALGLTVPAIFTRADAPSIQFLVPPPYGVAFNRSNAFMSVSPDGRMLAFSASLADGSPTLWLRSLDSAAVRELPGTDGAVLPFWSGDSRSVAFTSIDTLKTIEVATGRVRSLGPGTMSGAWNAQDVILARKQFPGPEGQILWRISAGTGEWAPATAANLRAGAPAFLPDGRRFVFLGVARDAPPGQPAMIHVGSLDSVESAPLVESDSPALYAAPGYLLYMRGFTLVAQRFDPGRLRLSGDPWPIVAQIDRMGGTGRAAFSVSQTGVLAYRLMRESELIWFDRNGKRLGTIGRPAHQANPALSPDGRLLAIQRLDPASAHSSLWIIDLIAGTERRFAPESTAAGTPLWTADGREIVYRDGDRFFRRGLDDGSGEVLVSGLTPQATPLGWVGGQRSLLFDDRSAPSMLDLHLLSLDGARTHAPLLHAAYDEFQGQLSPDGRWLAYASNESGRNAVYVRPFPAGDGAYLVTPEGGLEPRWRADGTELFFLAPDRSLMAVPVSTSPTLRIGKPARVFQTRLSTFVNGWFVRNQYLVTSDVRFLINQPMDGDAAITVETNWTARLPSR